MPDAIYDEPAPDGYEQHGWTCVYHRNWCHNPLDCAMVPLWRRKRAAREREHWKVWRDLTDQEREDARARARAADR